MRFGNSGGNNKGKKYLDRRNLDFNQLTAKDYMRLDDFNTWYIDNIDAIEQALSQRRVFDADTVNDTYAEICETLLFTGTIINSYMGYFHRAYFTNWTRASMQEGRYVFVENESLIDNLLQKDGNHFDRDELDFILEYVKNNYSMSEYLLFYQYINLDKPGYKILAIQTGKTVYEINKIIRKIRLDIKSHLYQTK